MGRKRTHRVLNIYGEAPIHTVENAISMAMDDGADNVSEALREISAAYAGWDAEIER